MSATIERIAHRALIRHAQERLNLIAEMREADELKHLGKSQREIADILLTTQPRVGRLLRAAVTLGDTPTPEEIILHATVDELPRDELIKQLCEIDYTFTEFAPYPHEGGVPGSWTQVSAAHLHGLLTDEEYEIVCAHVRPPTP
ncbi:helix-turn-helix domain-containing protein [Mycolicibacterium smegmatis]|uniref:helix-turn-helix domain-containing protein n=1 Tax=Mycolicibacterium smegmatis TaxID=1772 RepID=UPI0020A4C5C6|nr:helix-turn-helix domain-containing protein [Mycolicibacterium smegmatis]MCP2626072.1 helix-turn-helix domain-containing protein [Mycolicibacterium smegmatis]